MSKQMYLHAATNAVGSECSTELDITEDEWNKLSEEEQSRLLANSWVMFVNGGYSLRNEYERQNKV